MSWWSRQQAGSIHDFTAQPHPGPPADCNGDPRHQCGPDRTGTGIGGDLDRVRPDPADSVPASPDRRHPYAAGTGRIHHLLPTGSRSDGPAGSRGTARKGRIRPGTPRSDGVPGRLPHHEQRGRAHHGEPVSRAAQDRRPSSADRRLVARHHRLPQGHRVGEPWLQRPARRLPARIDRPRGVGTRLRRPRRGRGLPPVRRSTGHRCRHRRRAAGGTRLRSSKRPGARP